MKTMSRGDFIEAENRINPDEATRSRQQRQSFKKILLSFTSKTMQDILHNSPIIGECQTHLAKVLGLP